MEWSQSTIKYWSTTKPKQYLKIKYGKQLQEKAEPIACCWQIKASGQNWRECWEDWREGWWGGQHRLFDKQWAKRRWKLSVVENWEAGGNLGCLEHCNNQNCLPTRTRGKSNKKPSQSGV